MRQLKYKLDRKSQETIYTASTRPILEYGNVIWDNWAHYEKKNERENIQLEVARIATGATKLIQNVSVNNLYKETGWKPLEQRRKKL